MSALPRIPPSLLLVNLWGLVILLYLLYGFLPQAPYWIHVLRTFVSGTRTVPSCRFQAAGFVSVLMTIGPAVILSGAVLPLLFHALRHEVGDLGAVAGRLYSWNTVGSLVGALLGGYALFFWLDLHHVYRLAVGALVAAAALLTARRAELPTPLAATMLVGLFWGALALQAPWAPELLSAGLFRQRTPQGLTALGPAAAAALLGQQKVVFYDDDPTASIAVKEDVVAGALSRSVVTNGKSDSNTHLDRAHDHVAGRGAGPAGPLQRNGPSWWATATGVHRRRTGGLRRHPAGARGRRSPRR